MPEREGSPRGAEQLRQWVAGAGLTLHPAKTRIVNVSEKGGFDFPGHHFERGPRWPRLKSLDKFRETIRQKTGRLRPDGRGDITGEVNRTLRGWFEHFKHSVNNVFKKEDAWVRGRLRAILRQRHKGKGRARGLDPQRWPNAYFADLGLFSLARARAQAIQSRKRTH
jgi:RNA-directed DNA polymerase